MLEYICNTSRLLKLLDSCFNFGKLEIKKLLVDVNLNTFPPLFLPSEHGIGNLCKSLYLIYTIQTSCMIFLEKRTADNGAIF